MERLIELSNVCDISAGLVLRRKEAQTKNEIAKVYKVITLKSFEDDGWINLEYLDDYNSIELLDDRYITKENDILIRLSNPYTAIQVKAEQAGFVIPSLFAIVRLNQKEIDSGYLSFMLNSDTIKQSYFKNAMGITIPVIRMQTIRETQIPLVSTSEQHTISKISDLMIKEKRLHQQLTLEKELYNKELTKRIIKGGNKNAK
ncbi:restriction endonuclease subunit S [Peloplasma aerotolerans]|uniref:Restriction endonuclease subunit S n=1 Tax=Peloplasma aerotolerans TaxID=3044389 RepID=A0AAW6U7R2_9MOLU|nr:restriction endonuclease subunit S [Mariniplasma sp. M4Ah]MDI6452126.1 restriction endonuclease subunit S [Mariniplasma sp. M4Ah]